MIVVPPAPVASNALDRDLPSFLRLPGMAPDAAPVRVGIILPFTSSSAPTRALAASLMKAAELAMFDAGNRNILLITADEGNGGANAANAAQQLLAQGAEVIVGPLFGPSVSMVAPIARERGVPVLAFSTERSVAGNGAYLLSFLPQYEVRRVIGYAAANGHHQFAALAPQTAYGDVTKDAFIESVAAVHGNIVDVERYAPNAGAVSGPAGAVAHPPCRSTARRGTRSSCWAPDCGMTIRRWHVNPACRAAGMPRPHPMPMPILSPNIAPPSGLPRRSCRAWPMTPCRWWRCCRKAPPITALPRPR
jgi:hypothetical protein